jgi:hypothetical protein
MPTIRVVLPQHLQTLAKTYGEVRLDIEGEVTHRAVLDALEIRFPTLRGTMRDPITLRRRPLLRFFACERDLTSESLDTPLPAPVVAATEPFCIIGAIAGG